MANFFDQYDEKQEAPKKGNFFDQFDSFSDRFSAVAGSVPSAGAKELSERLRTSADKHPAAPAKGAMGYALQPITDYPSTYDKMNREARGLMSEGVSQASQGNVKDIAVGAGKTALGALGYVASPINAALRTVVGQPVEQATGIPKEWTEFAASLALPIPKTVRGPAASKAASKTAPAADELKAAAQAAYKSPEIAALTVKPDALVNAGQAIRVKLNTAGLDENLAPKTFGVLSRLDKVPPGSMVTGQNLESLRRTLGNAAKSTDPVERLAAQEAISALDDFVPNISKSDIIAGDASKVADILSDARGNYAAAMRSERVTDAAANANLQAGSANSGMNLDNATRQKIKSILTSEKQSRGFSEAELAQMERIVRGSPTGNLLRGVANLLGGGGGLGSVASGFTGAMATGSPLGALAPAVGFGLKKLSSRMTTGQVDKLDELVRSRSPLGKQMNAVVRNWSVAAKAYEINPSVRNAVKLSIASRNLSTNLRDADIDASPDQLAGTGESSSVPSP